jgi:two-component system sensor histidine kinase UhpB
LNREIAPELRHPFARALASPAWAGWRRPALRVRILGLLVLVNLVCAAAAGVVTIFNAREATRVEIASSLEIAEPFIRETVTRLQRDVGRLRSISDLQEFLPSVRHARIELHDGDGRTIAERQADPLHDEDEIRRVPGWFSALIRPAPSRIDVPVTIAGEAAGWVTIHGEASDEIAEVWSDLTSLTVLFLVLNVVSLLAFAALLKRVLAPLGALADGMTDLRLGRHDRRLEEPDSPELAAIVERFNALGVALAAERATNARMSWRMVTLQDDERRQIAKELHDELGPCLFGLRANLASLERDATGGPAAVARPELAERFAAVSDLSERLADMNRRLLRRLRPMALGAAPLADVLAGLMADSQRLHPERRLELSAEGLDHGYGEAVDLTIYRCVQEGVTNAIRHTGCSRVIVTVDPGRDENGAEIIRVRVQDNGGGVVEPASPGFGLVGLGERLRALGGGFELHNAGDGAALDMVVPLAHSAKRPLGRLSA